MKKDDLENSEEMAQILQSVYEQARQAKRMLLKVDIAPGKANAVLYKGTVAWINDLLRRLEFDKD